MNRICVWAALMLFVVGVQTSAAQDCDQEETGAHCPCHQVFKIIEDGEIVFFGGDVAPQLQQMKNKFIAKYDYDGRKCMELRQEWWERGEKEKWTFLFYHDIKTPVFSF